MHFGLRTPPHPHSFSHFPSFAKPSYATPSPSFAPSCATTRRHTSQPPATKRIVACREPATLRARYEHEAEAPRARRVQYYFAYPVRVGNPTIQCSHEYGRVQFRLLAGPSNQRRDFNKRPSLLKLCVLARKGKRVLE